MDCVKECVKKCGSVKKCANDILERAKCLVKECVKNIRARAGTIVFGVVYFTIVGFFLALQASMVGMGAAYIDECPREKFIPIYLIVGGSTGIVLQLWVILMPICALTFGFDKKSDVGLIGLSVLSIFSLVWACTGSTWIDNISGNFTVDDRTQPTYCSPTLYDYASSMKIVYWCLLLYLWPWCTSCYRPEEEGGTSESGPSALPCTDIDHHYI